MAEFSTLLVFIGVISSVPLGHGNPVQTPSLPLRMPNVQPTEPDTYLCYNTPIQDGSPIYITGFKPEGNMKIVHHMLLFGCNKPGNSNGKPWNCGEMHATSNQFKSGPVCGDGGESILYAWAMDAPELKLPKDVGFKIGGDTDIKSLVLQVHYKDVSNFLPPKSLTDNSGIVLSTTTEPQSKTAGVYIMMTGGSIPAHSTTYMEVACKLDEPVVIHPFAYRVHTHTHGEVVSGYKVHNGNWVELGRASPQKPQMFYPVTNEVTVKEGDVLAARCTMVNKDDSDVAIGSTSNDEMCNFYVMYYVDGDKVLEKSSCLSEGPPYWNWKSMTEANLKDEPDTASVVPEGDKLLAQSGHGHGMHHDMKNDMEMNNEMEEDGEPRNEGMEEGGAPIRDDMAYNPSELAEIYNQLQLNYPYNVIDEDNYLNFLPSFEDQLFDESLVRDLPIDESLMDDRSPLESDTMSVINDQHGGKGYVKTHNSFKNLNIPNGRGFVKSSEQESRYRWSPDGAEE